MTITASYSSVTRKLSIVGDAASNTITVSRDAAGNLFVNGGAVVISGGPATVVNTDLIEVSGIELDDVLVIDETNGPMPPSNVSGGLGVDTFIGSSNNDLFLGGDGNDTALLGAGDDTATWNPGDDNDVIEGQAGFDTLLFNGANVSENIQIVPNGGRVIFFRDIAAVTMDLNDVERIIYNALGGADAIVVNDLTGTDITHLTFNLAGTLGGSTSDGQVDLVALTGSAAAEVVTLAGVAGALTVNGLLFGVEINQTDAADVLNISGGGGGDTITATGLAGGVVALTLNGGAGNDTVTGSGGFDLLYGGADNDTLTGGDGDDQMFGEDGNDRMIWNPGDDTDLMEGGIGSDVAEVNGGNGAETFTITPNGTRVRFDRLTPAPFALDIGTTESLVLNANGGDDSISATGSLAALISLTLDGGAGNDTILAGNGADLILGGDGNDFVDGNQGNDTVFLGTGNDVFQWDPGDGSDIVEGQADADTLLFNGSAGDEALNMAANGGRVLLTRNLGGIAMDINDLETFTINAGGGVDTLTVNDLTGTDATAIALNLSGTIGGSAGDAAADTLIVNGSNLTNIIDITGAGTAFAVTGLAASITVTNSEGANDFLVVNALGGDDQIAATTLPSGVVKLTLDGGTGNDTLLGSQGADTFLGGDGNDHVVGDNGNDVAFLGAGNDVFQWDPGDGSDVVEGQADHDELRFNGSNASESLNIAANGGRILFTRDVANVTMDLDDVERIRFNAIGGTDNIVVGDLSGTDATNIDLDLTASGGGGDGAVDTVTVNAGSAAEAITVALAGGGLTVSGMPWTVAMFGVEGADRLTVNGQAGDDVINASTLPANFMVLTINAGLGADVIIGSPGADTVNGGDGNDTALLGAGDDLFTWNPGDDNDVIEGQAGTDTLHFNGSNVGETITISPNGGRILFFRDVAAVTMDLNDTETIEFAALGGADTITMGDLSGTDVTLLAIDLASTLGGAAGDAQVDTLTLNANDAANVITLTGTTGALLMVTGLPGTVSISQFETSGTVDRLTIRAGGGNDEISATGLIPKVATLTVDGGAGNDLIRSNGEGTYLGGLGNDVIYAGLTSSSEVLDGGDGVDTLDTTSWGGLYTINLSTGVTNYGGESFLNFENIVTGAGDDTISGTGAANVIVTGIGNDVVYADAGDDTLSGGAGNDSLEGGTGNDTMSGGTGDDVYFVDAAGDLVFESFGEGNDRIVATASYVLAAGQYVETLETGSASGTTAISLTGSDIGNLILGNNGLNQLYGQGGDDTLHGYAGADYLVGGLGLDNLYGGTGDDAYFNGTNDGDRIWEFAGEGYDTVSTLVDYTLPDTAYVERLEAGTLGATTPLSLGGSNFDNLIIGNAGNNTLRGFGGNDTLHGLGGDDVLIGDSGADVMYGGAGNDTYYINTSDDRAFENPGEGTNDRVATEVSFTLPFEAEIEVLEAVNLGGTSVGELGGSNTANTITGDAGNNVLRGGGGNDTLSGYLGNDTLIGDAGNDAMAGGAGDDVYFVDAAGDTITELAGQGNDRVATSVSFVLAASAEVEMLETANAAAITAINLTGSNTNNTIAGNAGANVLDGRGGNDILVGLGGADTFQFTAALGAGNVDQIDGFVSATDKIALDDAVFAALAPGALSAAAFVSAATAQDASDRIVYDPATGALYYDADGNGAGAAVQFATLSGAPALTAADFVVI